MKLHGFGLIYYRARQEEHTIACSLHCVDNMQHLYIKYHIKLHEERIYRFLPKTIKHYSIVVYNSHFVYPIFHVLESIIFNVILSFVQKLSETRGLCPFYQINFWSVKQNQTTLVHNFSMIYIRIKQKMVSIHLHYMVKVEYNIEDRICNLRKFKWLW